MDSSDENLGWKLISQWHRDKTSIHLSGNDDNAAFVFLTGRIEISGNDFALIAESGKAVFNRSRVSFVSPATAKLLERAGLSGKQGESVEIDVGTNVRYFLSVEELREGERVN